MTTNQRGELELFRHFLATIAYRFEKTVKSATDPYKDFEAGSGVRTPKAIINHMTHVLLYAKGAIQGMPLKRLDQPDPLTFEEEISRFYDNLKELDQLTDNQHSISLQALKIILQGPLADIMTHIGQLAMLRRLGGRSIKGESFMRAPIETGKFDY